jgi:hypothetical protein
MGPSLLDTDKSFAGHRLKVSGVVLPEMETMFCQVRTPRQLRKRTIARATNICWKGDKIVGLAHRWKVTGARYTVYASFWVSDNPAITHTIALIRQWIC